MMVGVSHFYHADSAGTQPKARELLSFGLRGHANAVFYLLWMSLPLFVLTAWYGPAAAGIFGIATQILDKLMLPAHVLHEAVYKRMRLIGRLEAAREAIAYAASIFLLAALGGLLMAPAVYWLVPHLLGANYVSSGTVTAMLLLGLPFASALLLLDPYFVNTLQRPGLASWLSALQVAIVAGLSLLIIPGFGSLGAAASLVLAQAFGLAVALYVLKRSVAGSASLLPPPGNLVQGSWMRMRNVLGLGQRP
jgi:O-antigen/teichoic acid export membrane protein